MKLITDHLTGPRPLHRRYPGQNYSQPAYVVLDCDADEPTLTAKVQGEVESNAVPAAVYYGLTRRWRLDAGLSGEDICALLERIAPLAEQLCAGWNARIKDGNRQGFLTPEAAEVEAEIERLVEEAASSPVSLCPRRTGRGRPPLPEARKKVGLTLPPALYERLREEAARQQRTISACITLAVQEWLEERKEK